MATTLLKEIPNYPWPATTWTYDNATDTTTVRSYFGAKSYSATTYAGKLDPSEDVDPEDVLEDWLAEYPNPVDLRTL